MLWPGRDTSQEVCSLLTLSKDSKNRIAWLHKRIEQQRLDTKAATALPDAGRPIGRIDDLTCPVVDILKELPEVEAVDNPLSPTEPTHRVVQFRDWHVVPKALFVAGARAESVKPLAEADVERLYQEHRLEVELVQLQQIAALRCLVNHYGLKRVYIERFTAEQVAGFKELVESLREAEPLQATLREQWQEAKDFLKKLDEEGKQETDRYAHAAALEKEMSEMLEKHRLQMLDIGAAGQLLVSKELVEVLPLDDATLLDAAEPVVADGKVSIDPAKDAKRREAMVKLALANDSVAVIVLGGSHDLSDTLRAVIGECCEYIRVTVPAYLEFSGEPVRK